MKTGTVRNYNRANRYGFIISDDDGKDIFVHERFVHQAGLSELSEGQRLEFRAEPDPSGRRDQAVWLRTIEAEQKPPRPDRRAEAPSHEISGYEDGDGLEFNTGYKSARQDGTEVSVTVDSLSITDRFLAARPGSVFKQERKRLILERYAKDISCGLQSKPGVADNPYNFVPCYESDPKLATEPERGKHDQRREERLSGEIEAVLKAKTPVFVPANEFVDGGNEGHGDAAREFFHCWDGSEDCYAIPGSSVKGAVRSLVEAFTNSRAGVIDQKALEHPPLYRRRSFKLFKVLELPENGRSGVVARCDYGLYDYKDRCNSRTNCELPQPDTKNGVTEKKFNANLFHVDPEKHNHRWKKIRYRPTGEAFKLQEHTVKCFEETMRDHPHFMAHGGKKGTAAVASKKHYRGLPPEYDSIENQLHKLQPKDLIFGMTEGNDISCFGRNVNFLWPADLSMTEMMSSFMPRPPNQMQLEGSDTAEAMFGFAGTHGSESHPFRGRVRFGTFWGPPRREDCLRNRKNLKLMPLTAPSGTKAKSRPLYLAPNSAGEAADHDANAKPRGRKFYWHQKGPGKGQSDSDDVPPVHRLDKMQEGVPEDWKEQLKSQLQAPIRPLPQDTEFKGKVHFSNLTKAELGSLLVALDPNLAFSSEESRKKVGEGLVYGIKVGKGKPRGLGSVVANLTLRIENAPACAYAALASPLMQVQTEEKMHHYVDAYKTWIAGCPRNWRKLDFAKALERLLRLPEQPSSRVYPPHFSMYGWLPKDNDSAGAPRGARPKAMTPAHET